MNDLEIKKIVQQTAGYSYRSLTDLMSSFKKDLKTNNLQFNTEDMWRRINEFVDSHK